MKKQLSALLAASVILSNFSPAISIYASDSVKETIKTQEKSTSDEATVSKATIRPFDLKNNSQFEAYNTQFKIASSAIKSVSTNGGQYGSNAIGKVIDDNLSTHWETGKQNSNSFKNEIVFDFEEAKSFNRIAYATRQDGAKGKGFPTKFEIYTSLTGNEEDYQLAVTGEHTATGNMMEFEFPTITAKKVKFVYVEAHQNWASASEFWFYKEDAIINQMNNIFTNELKNELSTDFNTIEKINEFEAKASTHPLFDTIKEDLDNAKALLEIQKPDYMDAVVSTFIPFQDERLESYDALFKVPTEKITSITTNGEHYSSNDITKAIDNNVKTNWHSGKQNNSTHTNEVIMTLDELTTVNRIMYTNTNSRGFAEAFDIYISPTTQGDTFEKVTSGQMSIDTKNTMEILFNPTATRRIKFVFTKGYENWALASEFGIYQEDELSEIMNRLFIDESLNEINPDFATIGSIESLIEVAKGHPFATEYLEKLNLAKELIEFGMIQSGTSNVSKFSPFYTDYINQYDEQFRVPIDKITTNGGQYGDASIKFAIDEDPTTHWETGKPNSASFKNEVILSLKQATEIDRLTYTARTINKGFPTKFSIYISPVASGDNFQKVSEGGYTVTNDMIEIKFDKTKAKRVKFVFEEVYQDYAAIGDIRVYQEDVVSSEMKKLFTTGLMDEVSPEYNTIEKLEALEKSVQEHPLAAVYAIDIQKAKDIINNQLESVKTIVAEQHGDRDAHANQNLKFGFGNNYQPTGVVALAGQEVVVYVDAEPGQPLPQLVFSQQEGSFARWARSVSLHIGKNVITVPAVNQEGGGFVHNVTPGGPVYILNPYTPEQQSKAPVIRFEKGIEKFPMMDANTNEQEFLDLLKDYKTRLDADAVKNPNVMDRQMIDVVEIVSDHLVFTGTTTGAYTAYIEKEFGPMKTVQMYNDHMKLVFDYLGLDGRDEKNDAKYTRENIRLAQPFGYMYAASGHIGVQGDVMVNMLTSVGGWGVDHEMGHKLDIGVRTLGEVTNNMIPQNSSYYYNKPNRRIPFENYTFKQVIEMDNYNYADAGYFEKLAVFWQLEMIYPGYWGKLNRQYRENQVVLDQENEWKDRINQLAKHSSIALELDLTEHFQRHGFDITDETKEAISQYKKPEIKTWYANYDYIEYEGTGFTTKPGLKVNIDREGELTKLTFNVNDESKEDVLGYEIFKNNELIGFTSTNQFVDSSSNPTTAVDYTIVPYDKRLNTGESLTINSLTPSLQLQQSEIHIKLKEQFDPMTLVRADNYAGEDITDYIVVNHQINPNEKGSYLVEYSIKDQGVTTTETLTVHVVSDYEYLSDQAWTKVETQHGTPRRNTNLKGRVNNQMVTFEKGFGIHANGKITYDLSNMEYDTFEALVGVDAGTTAQTNSSIKFNIIADGQILATTPTLKYDDNLVLISVPVNGVQELSIEINDGGNGNTSDHAVIVNPKLTTNNAKPSLITKDQIIKVSETPDLMAGISAQDAEDGDLTPNVEIIANTFEEGKVGRFEVTYAVTDSDKNTVEKSAYVTVYEDYIVEKSNYDQFENLSAYQQAFKLPVTSVTNNGGNYGSSVIAQAIDGNLKTHWETGKSNDSNFKNEVIFDLGEVTEVSRMAYASRRDAGGKGFATTFEIYASTEAEGDDFYLVGQGTYSTKTTDVVELELSDIAARRLKFKFVEANQGWASLSEVAFYREDPLADKIKHDLFTDANQTDVAEAYNTLEKVEALRVEVKDHPAYPLFESLLAKAEQLIEAKVPVLTVTDKLYVELNSEVNLMADVSAHDQEDGDLTSKVIIEENGFNSTKAGEYQVTYTVVDTDQNKVSKTRTIIVHSTETNLTDLDWTSATSGWKNVNKDSAVNTTNKIKLNVNGEAQEFNKGIGAAANAEIIYPLNGEYHYFTTYLGTDKNYNHNQTSVIFKIYADGEEVYTSDLIKRDSLAQRVDLNVTGVQELKLVALDAGDGITGDYVSWANPKLYQTNAKPQLTIEKDVAVKVGETFEDVVGVYTATDAEDGLLTSSVIVTGAEHINFERPGKYEITYQVVDSDGNQIEKTRTISVVDLQDFDYLTDHEWTSAKQSYGTTRKDQSASNNTLRLTDADGNTISYDRGIGSHANATIIYDLTDKDYDFFTAYVGVDRAMHGSVGSVQFEVYVDGELAFDSGVMNSRDSQQYIEVSLAGANELKLVVKDGGNGNGSDHATWADTRLHFANSERVYVEALEQAIEAAEAIQPELYTPNSVKSLEEILNQAKDMLQSSQVTQDQIDDMTQKLNETIEQLILLGDYQALEQVIKDVESINKEDYTSESISALEQVLTEAKDMLVSLEATQQQINEMAQRLTQAFENLVLDYSSLETLLEELKQLNANLYTSESKQAIETAKANLEEILANQQLNAAEIKALAEQTKQMIATLQLNPDKVLIQTKLDEVQALNRADVQGEKHADVRWENFLIAKATLETLLTTDDATQEQINQAVWLLDYAVSEVKTTL